MLNLALSQILLVGHALKIANLKAPIYAADIEALPLLISTLSGRYLVIGYMLIGVLLFVVVCSLRIHRRSIIAIVLGGAYVTAVVMSSGKWAENLASWVSGGEYVKVKSQTYSQSGRIDGQVSRLKMEGGLLYLLTDWEEMKRDTGFIPSREEVLELNLERWQPISNRPTRNVHMIVLESIWDTSVLDNLKMVGNPIDPRFSALWEQAGKPHALSPVIGGATANSEFEALCGLPSPSNSIAFLGALKNHTPCIPAMLQRIGYRSIASHPHEASNWGRDHAYDLIGFQEFNAIDAFDLDDMEGSFLSDSSLFRQNFEMLQFMGNQTPVFNYVVSLSSHWAYPRNSERRPNKVSMEGQDFRLLPDYLNSSAYTTSAFMDWVYKVLAADPDALIIAFGDHSPVLDNDPDVYQLLGSKVEGKFDSPRTRRLIGMTRVPLLIIDGANGPLKLEDDIPLFSLPRIVGQQLGLESILPYGRPEYETVVHPLLGMLLVKVDGNWLHCGTMAAPSRSPSCDFAWELHQQNRVIRQDLVAGEAHTLNLIEARELLGELETMEIAKTYKACDFEIKQWGPTEASVGQSFYTNPDGSSTIWITFNKLRGAPTMQFGGTEMKVVVGDKLMTGSLPTPQITGKQGDFRVSIKCSDDESVQVGLLKIKNNP